MFFSLFARLSDSECLNQLVLECFIRKDYERHRQVQLLEDGMSRFENIMEEGIQTILKRLYRFLILLNNMKKRFFTLIVLVVLSALLIPSCFAICINDSVPEIRLSCATPDSLNIENLEFLTTEVTIHGYYNATSPHKRLSYDEAYKIAEMDSFPSDMLDRKNIRFKTKRINVPNFGKCHYYIFQFKDYSGVFLNGMMHILYNPSKKRIHCL